MTNDGATILEKMDVNHQVGFLLRFSELFEAERWLVRRFSRGFSCVRSPSCWWNSPNRRPV